MYKQKFQLNQIDTVASHVANIILEKKDYVIFLIGPTGAGKTTLIKHTLKKLGVNSNQVKSPSFALKRIYKTNKHIIYHLDLHRLEGQNLDDLELHETGIYLIEWGNIAKTKIKPDLTISLEYCQDENEREIKIENL